MDFAKWNRLLAKTLAKNLEADFRNLSKFETELFEQKPWASFETNQDLKITAAKKLDFDKPKLLQNPETWFERLKPNLNRT